MSQGPGASTTASFRAVSFPWRLYSGRGALQRLPSEVRRLGGSRAMVICGRSIARRTDLVPRIRTELGPSLVGVFDAMDKDCTYEAVTAATEAARAVDADVLVAVGGGSTVVGTRGVAVFLGEAGDPLELMTQYREGEPPRSPRLMAPKLPIINVVTTPTTAVNRAGTALKNDKLDHRMEFFDPKTRPAAIFWDIGALLTAPPDLVRSAGTTTFASALEGRARPPAGPLQECDFREAFRLASQALPQVTERPDDPGPRVDLCAAALLVNRADDDGGRPAEPSAAWGHSYALATALHIHFDQVGQGEATSSVFPSVLRQTELEPGYGESLAAALGVPVAGLSGYELRAVVADGLAAFYRSIGMPVRLGELDIPRGQLPVVAQDTVKNFNANPRPGSDDRVDRMLELLESAW